MNKFTSIPLNFSFSPPSLYKEVLFASCQNSFKYGTTAPVRSNYDFSHYGDPLNQTSINFCTILKYKGLIFALYINSVIKHSNTQPIEEEIMRFRPCIDLHQGKVKQIVGSSLSDDKPDKLITNFTSSHSVGWYASLYKKDGLTGGHIIQLGSNNEKASEEALNAWEDGLQLGGGINSNNAENWLNKGAEKVIVTSYVFSNGKVHQENLDSLVKKTGKDRLVLDLSCRKKDGKYWIVTDRWQKFTSVEINNDTLDFFANYCCEFLIHAVDKEGKNSGIEKDLIQLLGNWGKLSITYAGGIASWQDIKEIKHLGNGKIDFTVGSALDLFGGDKIEYQKLVELQKNNFKDL